MEGVDTGLDQCTCTGFALAFLSTRLQFTFAAEICKLKLRQTSDLAVRLEAHVEHVEVVRRVERTCSV